MRPLKEKVSIKLDNNVIPGIKELAEQNDYSFSQYINLILKRHLQHSGYLARPSGDETPSTGGSATSVRPNK